MSQLHGQEKHDHDHKIEPSHEHNAGQDHEAAHADEVKLTADAIKKYGVTVEPAKLRTLTPTFVASARVSFNTNAMAHVGSAVKGRIAELKAQVGDLVKKDDVLLIVESPELGEAQSDFLQKRAAATTATPLIETARQAYERGKSLYEETKGISISDLQKRETDYKAAQTNAMATQAAATAAENKLRLLGMDRAAIESLASTRQIDPHCVVRAPLTGQVTEREVTLGELVSPDREHLLIMADMSLLWVLADVPEARLANVSRGSEARVTLAAAPDRRFKGTVSFIAQTVDSATRTAKVRIEVPNEKSDLKPGMFAIAEISTAAENAGRPVLAIPDEAIQTVEGGPAVFVPVDGEENTFAKRALTVGKTVGGWTPVLSGLKEGEAFVAAGSFILKADLGKAGAAHEH